jgi:hypothetical protein
MTTGKNDFLLNPSLVKIPRGDPEKAIEPALLVAALSCLPSADSHPFVPATVD